MKEKPQTPSGKPKSLPSISGTVDLKPGRQDTLEAALGRASQLLKTRKLADFKTEIAKAQKLGAHDPRTLHLLGLYEFETRNTVAAARLIKQALSLDPKNAAMQHNLAAVLISLGRFADAEVLLLSAIAQKPDYAEAFHTLAPIRKFKPGDPLIPQMEAGLKKPSLSAVDVSFYAFALAKALDDIGAYEKAWPALERGNAAMPTLFKPDREAEAVGDVEKLVTKERLQALAPYGHQSQAPVLVVGMPRSGTTLLESVLAEHPQIYGAGEMTSLGGIGRMMSDRLGISQSKIGFAQAIAQTEPKHVYAAGLGYLNSLRKETDSWFDHCIDKLPDNSFALGFAAAIVPNAKVIHIMRHPLDVMLSIYFQRFTTVQYGFDPKHILSHWSSYQRAMAHWRRTLPHEMIELRYENLVQDTTFAQTYLWDRLGLTQQIDHVPAATEIKQQRTASRYQVKQPVYQSSKEKFRRYETQMSAFIKGMGGMEAIEAEVAAQEARCALRQAAAQTAD